MEIFKCMGNNQQFEDTERSSTQDGRLKRVRRKSKTLALMTSRVDVTMGRKK